MEIFHQTLLLLLVFLLPFGSAFSPNNSVYLDCGATSSVSLSTDSPPRTFKSDSGYVSGSNSISLTNPNPPPSPSLYSAARFFSSAFTYQFSLAPNSSNVLRLHFLPFSAQSHNLSDARFNVTALNQFVLLADFSVSDTTGPTIKEFFLWIDSGTLDLQFNPDTSSFAFINAIEVFTAPSDLLSDPDPTKVSTASSFKGEIANQAMETMYRVNVGGPMVTPGNDTLWRTWVPDDTFLYSNPTSLENSTSLSQINYYPPEGSSEEIAPKSVYSTARTLDITDTDLASNNLFNVNVTWRFHLDPGFYYLIRLHFCDFLSKTINPYTGLAFNVYIMDSLVENGLRPASQVNYISEPFYRDYILNVESSQNITVSISRADQSVQSNITNAILNGLEIMKMNNTFASLSGTYNPLVGGNNKKKISLAVILGSALGGGLVIAAILFCLLIVFNRKRRSKPVLEVPETPASWSPYTAGITSVGISSKSGSGTTIVASPRVNLGLLISLAQIKTATNNFDEKNLIGVGGFGKVFKGVLTDGTRVAVKRATARSNQGFPEFQTEIEVLSQIRHRHLVSLIGYCDEHSEMILVYEYMEKGPLRNYLYGTDLPCLSWKQRLQVCIGAAKGLHYLHTGYSQNIIHRDVKSTNILLGEEFLSKVSDFGLSKLGPTYGQTHVSTAVKGSFGYLDPEYFKTQKLTDKSDVYSFGVMLFEVLCARPVIDQSLEREQVNLAEWALTWQRRGKLEKVVDPRLVGQINENSLRKFGETTEKCLAEYGIDRPAIGDVLWNLEYCLQLQETEVRREPYEDSGTAETQFPVPLVRQIPSSNIVSHERSVVSSESQLDMTTSNVFSQLMSSEGR